MKKLLKYSLYLSISLLIIGNFLTLDLSTEISTDSLFKTGPMPAAELTSDKYPYSDIFRLEQGSTKFYVTSLEPNEIWSVNLTSNYQGIFYMFIFQNRPTNDFILSNFSLDPAIYQSASVYNNSVQYIYDNEINQSVANVRLDFNYTGAKTRLIYLQIVLVENGPDSYLLQSSHILEPYYIPFIAGFDYGLILISLVISQFALIFEIKRRKHFENG